MKSLFTYIFTLSIFMQPATALAADYSDFDSFCQTLQQHELEIIKMEVERGLMTKAEGEAEIGYMPDVEQCVCFFQTVLDGTGADFTLYTQKAAEIEMVAELKMLADENYNAEASDDYVYGEVAKLEMPAYPEGLDITAFMDDTEKACGFVTE